ncbi:MAG: DNA-binding response regulator [Micrococcales bacterium]|jgi:two-component system response regulator MtrA|nr:DNA-binding response regulator [Microbacteriaceae bacterium]NBR24799.1 DNA-binding response regulator [Micrococcales bacterium]NBR77591.1 DNA-binding response regulator [Microbacteriaceae bacterium]NBS85396.1 DNA-binding response regulator [Micrococcales bacterium]NBX94587.1 DNA-binding response regulator [Actinomycetota bacterium]
MFKILIVEDDDALRETLEIGLRSNGFDVCQSATGTDAIPVFEKHKPDLVLLDLMLPGKNGIEICHELRQTSGVPIIMLTARTDDNDMIRGLEAGADDYVTKPYKIEVLVSRIKARLRPIKQVQHTIIKLGPIEIDTLSHEVLRNGKRVSLTPLEFKLLLTLASHPNEVFSREMLLEQVWEYTYKADTRLVNVHVQRLRSKIEEDQEDPKLVLTVRGWGYKAGPE